MRREGGEPGQILSLSKTGIVVQAKDDALLIGKSSGQGAGRCLQVPSLTAIPWLEGIFSGEMNKRLVLVALGAALVFLAASAALMLWLLSKQKQDPAASLSSLSCCASRSPFLWASALLSCFFSGTGPGLFLRESQLGLWGFCIQWHRNCVSWAA